MNNIKTILADWNNQKCNPAVIPFAGIINNSKDTTPFEFTGQNFTGCVQSILTNITSNAFQPFYYIIKTITTAFNELADAINNIRAELNNIRNSIKDFSTETMGRTLNITMPLVQMMISIKDMGSKMIGVLSASLFTLVGSYLTLKSFFLFIIDLIVTILIIMAGILAALIVANVFAFGALSPVIAVNTGIMIAVLIPTIMIKIFMDDIMKLSTRDVPDVPSCFAGDTMVKTFCNADDVVKNIFINKKIPTIEVGDILIDGAVVTGIMKLSSKGQTIYNLEDIIVSGEHKVVHPTLGWLHVKNHPKSRLVNNFNEPYLYCLLTSNKIINIYSKSASTGTMQFCDWDDINDDVLEKINKNCVPIGYIPDNFKNEDIHSYLDNGLHKSTIIKLKNGRDIPINNIKINDILLDGEKVLATIKIDAINLKEGINEFHFSSGIDICCSRNININNYLGGINTFNLYGKPIFNGEPYLYQLLTTTGSFNANGLIIGDYNNGLDRFLNRP
jgi:hypothetical protein